MSVLDLVDKCVNAFFAFLPRKKPPAEQLKTIRLIAHRGAHNKKLQYIENTDAAFAAALEMGCWGIELDVHATADDIIVVNHDACLNRLWNTNLAITATTFQQLRQSVPDLLTLSDVIARYGKKIHLFIELKTPFNSLPALLNTLKPLTPVVDYHLLSLDESLFSPIKELPRETLLLVAEHNNVAQLCKSSLDNNYGGVLGHYLLLSKAKINLLKQAKQQVGVGFVDSKYSLYREANRGLQWLFTNNAAEISRCLKHCESD